MWILSTRNFFQLRATFKHYKQNYQVPIYQAIMSSGSHDLGSLLRVVILCIDAPEKHFAEVIRASLSGHRTDVHSLARAILARVEIDMMKIKEEYFNMNKVSLDDAVVGKTSGGYKDFLMTLIGARI
ncbi:Annexin D3 [Vitis vinifera]|nr:Annexin D3 [Vitis vinifera]